MALLPTLIPKISQNQTQTILIKLFLMRLNATNLIRLILNACSFNALNLIRKVLGTCFSSRQIERISDSFLRIEMFGFVRKYLALTAVLN